MASVISLKGLGHFHKWLRQKTRKEYSADRGHKRLAVKRYEKT